MAIREIKSIDDETRHIALNSGEIVILRFEIGSVGVYVDDYEVGRIDFRTYEVPIGQGHGETFYHLTHAFIEGGEGKYKHQGIGTEAVRLFRECTGSEITFSDNDGHRKEDGSHLTGDGPTFVESLKRKIARGEL